MQLVPRKEKTITETATESITVENTIVSTITEHVNTTVYSSFFFTKTITATVNQTHTTTLPASDASSLRPATPVRVTSTTSRSTKNAASTSDAASGQDSSKGGPHLSAGPTVGVVVGSLLFVALLAGALFASRRMLQKYRRQRVARKEARTEGNDMPVGLGYSQGERNASVQPHQRTGETMPSYQMTGSTGNAMARPLTSHHTSYPPEKQEALWEEPPPSYPS